MRKEVIVICICLILLVTFSLVINFNIDKNLKIVKGRIVRLIVTTKGNDSWEIIFSYKGKIFKSGCPCVNDGCYTNCFDNIVKGQEISVAIDSTNPFNNITLSTKQEYLKYKIEYPLYLDSLHNCKK